MEFLIIIPLWALGVAATVGIPGSIATYFYLRSRKQWVRLERSRVRVKGPRPVDQQLDLAFLAFAQGWSAMGFEGDVRKLMNGWYFEFVKGDSFSDSQGSYRGRTLSRKLALVAEREGAPIGRLTVFHEAVHLALWGFTGEPDPDHGGSKYKGWTEKHTALVSELKRRFALKTTGTSVVRNLEVPAEEEGVKACGTCSRMA